VLLGLGGDEFEFSKDRILEVGEEGDEDNEKCLVNDEFQLEAFVLGCLMGFSKLVSSVNEFIGASEYEVLLSEDKGCCKFSKALAISCESNSSSSSSNVSR